MDPNRSSVRALLASLGLAATATPACGGKATATAADAGTNVESPSDAMTNGNNVTSLSDAMANGDSSLSGTFPFGNTDSGSAPIPFGNAGGSGTGMLGVPSAMDAATGGDAKPDTDGSSRPAEAGEPLDARTAVDAAALCCACGNAACCDPGCPGR